jgi:hypothetical protein
MFKKISAVLFIVLAAQFCLCASGVTNVILRNNTRETFISMYVIEEDSLPVNQTVNLIPSSLLEKLIKKNFKKSEINAEGFDSSSLGKSEKLWMLRVNVPYKILFESEEGNLYLRDNIRVVEEAENLVIEFKKSSKTDRNWITDYTKKHQEEARKSQEIKDLKKPVYAAAVSGLVLLGAFLAFIIIDWKKQKKNGGKDFFGNLIGTYPAGKRWAEIAGVFVMMIPVVLSFMQYQTHIEKTYFWFFTHKIEKTISIQATFVTAVAAVFLYGSYIVRYNFFKKETAEQVFFSIIQSVVNIWALAGLCSILAGNEVWSIPLINISSSTFLLLVVLLSWIGARSIAGFLWVALIIIDISHLTEINNAMGLYGALYIIFMFISLLLQMSDIVHLEDFKNDFLGGAKKAGQTVTRDIKASKDLTETVVKTLL